MVFYRYRPVLTQQPERTLRFQFLYIYLHKVGIGDRKKEEDEKENDDIFDRKGE